MKIFMTGASGFLGSHTAELLHQRGHQIQALVRPSSQTTHLTKLKIPFVLGALPHCEKFEENLEDQDVIIHIAAVVKALSKKDFIYQNALSTHSLVKSLLKLKNKPKKLIYISTIAVHDPNQSEDFCLASEQCQALSYYGYSKLESELALSVLKEEMPVTILRPPVIYGERDWELYPLMKSIQRGFAPVLGKGEKQFSMCYVKDVAEAIARLVERQNPNSEIFCLDDGEEHSWKSVAEHIAKAFNREVKFFSIPEFVFTLAAALNQTWSQIRRKPSVFTLNKLKEMRQERWICGNQKLQQAIGWKPQTALTEGLHVTLNYYRSLGKIT